MKWFAKIELKNGVGVATDAAAAAPLAMKRKSNVEQQQYPNRFVKRALRLLNWSLNFYFHRFHFHGINSIRIVTICAWRTLTDSSFDFIQILYNTTASMAAVAAAAAASLRLPHILHNFLLCLWLLLLLWLFFLSQIKKRFFSFRSEIRHVLCYDWLNTWKTNER